MIEIKPNRKLIQMDKKYLTFFYNVVIGGYICGLEHPIEWIVNAHRMAGATLPDEYYTNIEKHVPQFLYEFYEISHLRKAKNSDEIFKWHNDHYKHNTFVRNYWLFLESQIQEYIDVH